MSPHPAHQRIPVAKAPIAALAYDSAPYQSRTEPHQANPAQAADLDQVATAGSHRITVDTPGPDFGPATPFHGFVDAEHQRTIATVQMLD